MDPNFWSDPDHAEGVMRELKIHKNWVKQYTHVEDHINDLEILFDFQKEGEATVEEVDAQYDTTIKSVEEAEFKSTLNKEEDELSAIIEINAGAGGTEACDWAEMLYRMYVMHGEKTGYKVKELNRVPGDVAGVRSVSIELAGDYSYGMLKGENGVHRLVRVSPYNAQGKRMTSFASVFVPVSYTHLTLPTNREV